MKRPVDPSELVEAIRQTLTTLGLSNENADTVARHVVDAETLGMPSHGLSRLRAIIESIATGDRNGPGSFELKTPTVLKYTAHGQLGIVAMKEAAEKVVAVANENYLCVMAVTGYVGTTGVLGSYTRLLADKGLVGIAFCGSEYAVAPYGGARAILGTNPISIAFPSAPIQFNADLATAAWSYGDLKLAMNENRRVPPGVVQDIDGNESTDPNDADNGSQLSMAGHKGYALGLAVELLCGPLIGAKAGRTAVPGNDGALIIALRSDSFRSADDVVRDANLLFDEIERVPLAPSVSKIRIPGDSYEVTMADRKQIVVDIDVLNSLGITIG